MNDYIGKYGLLGYLPKNGLEKHVHPDDVEKLQSCWGTIKMCRAIDSDDVYLHLFNGENHFRVTPQLFQVMEAQPKFNFGDMVREKHDLGREGTIHYVCWHYERMKVYYLLKIKGKESNRWNFDEDLQLISEKKL